MPGFPNSPRTRVAAASYAGMRTGIAVIPWMKFE